MKTPARIVGVLTFALAPAALLAQGGAELGQREYMNSCAQCHGAAADGNGVMAEFLTKPAPDLTSLQSSNGGVFPVAGLYDVIKGSDMPGAHGTSEMPAWGARYDASTPSQLGEMYSPADRDAFVRGRMLALIEHLSTLQQP